MKSLGNPSNYRPISWLPSAVCWFSWWSGQCSISQAYKTCALNKVNHLVPLESNTAQQLWNALLKSIEFCQPTLLHPCAGSIFMLISTNPSRHHFTGRMHHSAFLSSRRRLTESALRYICVLQKHKTPALRYKTRSLFHQLYQIQITKSWFLFEIHAS